VSALQGQCRRDNHNPQRYRPRGPQRDFVYPRPVQSLPPLRAFLRNEGIDTDIEPRQQSPVSATHEVAREEARRRAIRATATRYVSLEHTEAPSHYPPLCHTKNIARFSDMNTEMPPLSPSTERSSPWMTCTGQDTTEGWPLYPQFSALIDRNHRNRDFREFSPYQKVVRRSMPSSYIASGDDCHARKTFSPLRPCGSRVGTVEERMSREVETFVCVFSASTALKG
jgi:hypothetical protein